MFDTVGLAPHTTTSFESTTCVGSAEAIEPNTLAQAAPAVAAQMVGATSVAPNAANSISVPLDCSSNGTDELYVNPTTPSGPTVWSVARMRLATRSRASSHEQGRNSPDPFGPVRTSGVSTRSGAYTRSACRFTLAQIQPWVCGLSGAASMCVMRPSVMVTASEHASGQSSVHTVVRT